MRHVCWSSPASLVQRVSGRNDLNEEESRQLDVSYVQDWSVMGDVVYILRTIGTVLHPSGAY